MLSGNFVHLFICSFLVNKKVTDFTKSHRFCSFVQENLNKRTKFRQNGDAKFVHLFFLFNLFCSLGEKWTKRKEQWHKKWWTKRTNEQNNEETSWNICSFVHLYQQKNKNEQWTRRNEQKEQIIFCSRNYLYQQKNWTEQIHWTKLFCSSKMNKRTKEQNLSWSDFCCFVQEFWTNEQNHTKAELCSLLFCCFVGQEQQTTKNKTLYSLKESICSFVHLFRNPRKPMWFSGFCSFVHLYQQKEQNCKGSACGSVACLKHCGFPSGMGGGKALRDAIDGPHMGPGWGIDGPPTAPPPKTLYFLAFSLPPLLQTSSPSSLILGSGRRQNC